jgi:hypothetical protein
VTPQFAGSAASGEVTELGETPSIAQRGITRFARERFAGHDAHRSMTKANLGPRLALALAERQGGSNQMTEPEDRREGGAWIGQHPDENTKQVREELDEGAERVAVTNNEPGRGDAGGDDWPRGHREGDQAGDDDVRRAGENG